MKTRQLVTVAIATACMVATGCSGFVAGGGSSGAAAVPKSALCPGKKASKNITVVNFWEPFAQKPFLQSIQDFNCANPGIAINVSVNGSVGDDSNGKLLAAVAAHKPPDLTLSTDDVLSGWASKGELQPLDKLAAADGIKSSDYVDTAVQDTTWDGQLYGVPVDWDPDTLLWYNKKIFAQVGLDPNKPPTTWAQVASDAAKINEIKDGKIKRLGFVPWDGWEFNEVQLGHEFGANEDTGSKLASTQTPKVVLDSPGMRKTFEYEAQVAKQLGGADKINSFVSPNGVAGAAADPLVSGRVGMYLIGDWELGSQLLVGDSKFRSTIGVASMPTPPGGQKYLSHSGWAFTIPKGAKNADAAMKYVQWIEQTPNYAKYMGPTFGWLPARTSSLSLGYLKSDPTWQKILAIQNNTGQQWWLAPSPILSQYDAALETAQTEVIDGKQSPPVALQSAQKLADDALKNATARHAYK